MDQTHIIEATKHFVKQTLEKDSSGHDWLHIERVWKMARQLAQAENANPFIVELAALLHDIADWKFHDGDTEIGPQTARNWLTPFALDEAVITSICNIIRDTSFKGAHTHTPVLSLEGQIVQDADRLDAIGAIGIARTFAYGGYKGRPIYDFNIPPVLHHSFEQYKKNQSHTLNHFYEKLLLLKDRMNTKSAKKIAARRHAFMEKFLEELLNDIQ